MNTQHLRYIIEIERTRSISQAAENLYLGQPNLSRILRETEEAAGFAIFERTSRGVRPTERGALFLQHAHSILREVESMDALCPHNPVPNRLRVCIPRSYQLFEALADYLGSLPADLLLNAAIRECHARQALQWLISGDVEIAVLRFRSESREYFTEQSAANGLDLQIFSRFRYQFLMHRNHPLACKSALMRADLADFPEIVHSDIFRLGRKSEEQTAKKSTPSTAWRSSRCLSASPEAICAVRLSLRSSSCGGILCKNSALKARHSITTRCSPTPRTK